MSCYLWNASFWRRCGAEDVDYAKFGVGTCDYDCAGDDAFICGGYLSFTVYEIGERREP